MISTDTVNVLCVKWGTLYGPHYVNRLYDGVKRHLNRPFRFVCVTDDATGLSAGVEAFPFPPVPDGFKPNRRYTGWPNIYIKLLVFQDGFAGLTGPTLFLDVDQIITGDLDRFFDYEPGKFCIIRNWIEWRKRIFKGVPLIGNSSCFRFEAGKMNYVYEKFMSEIDEAVCKEKYSTEQIYMTHAVGADNIRWWPKDWVKSFKRSCVPVFPLNLLVAPALRSPGAILCFHGDPNPDQAIRGYRGKHLNMWIKPCPWIRDLWEGCRCRAGG